MFHDLLSYILVVSDFNHSVAPIPQLASRHLIPRRLVWLIMHRSVAKDTDIRCVEKIWNTAWFRNCLLRLVRQTMMASG
jgi:hypothetical protein